MTSLIFMILLALGLLAALALFVSLKLDVERRSRADRVRVEAILARVREADPTPAPSPLTEQAFSTPQSGLNLSKRVRVMRLLREGQDTGQIASALGLPRGEVQLLASIQTLTDKAMKTAAGE
jgi:hypothetical protein